MQLFLLICLTLCAFAGNSLLNRLGVAGYGMDPVVFAVIRVASGAAMLGLLVLGRGRPALVPRHWGGACALAGYMFGFSWAYLSLGAGIGALILFGVVQIVMFGWAILCRKQIAVLRWVGAGIAFGGLMMLLWPAGDMQVPLAGALSMAFAGAAWAAYTLLGQGNADALGATAVHFIRALPLLIPTLLFASPAGLTLPGVASAVVAGALTSGLGYALWYRVLPLLPISVAAVAQLSVPVIAVGAGVLLLGEPISARVVVAGALVLGGIALSFIRRG